MSLLIHYHTATRETIVPVSKRMKTGDAKAGDDVLTPSCRIFKGMERRCARCGRPRAAHFAVRNSGSGDAAWDALQEQLGKTVDASKEQIEEFIAKAKAAGKTPEQIAEALRTWTVDAETPAERKARQDRERADEEREERAESVRKALAAAKAWNGKSADADEIDEQIKRLKRSGVSIAAIAQKFGLDEEEVRESLRDTAADADETPGGVVINGIAFSAEEVKKYPRKVLEISAKTGREPWSIHTWLNSSSRFAAGDADAADIPVGFFVTNKITGRVAKVLDRPAGGLVRVKLQGSGEEKLWKVGGIEVLGRTDDDWSPEAREAAEAARKKGAGAHRDGITEAITAQQKADARKAGRSTSEHSLTTQHLEGEIARFKKAGANYDPVANNQSGTNTKEKHEAKYAAAQANAEAMLKAHLAKAKTGDSDEPHPFVGEKADNGDGIGDCEECGKPFKADAHWRTADVKKTTDAALDLGAPVNREYLRLQKAVPGDKTIRTQLEAKFTPEQVKAWESYF